MSRQQVVLSALLVAAALAAAAAPAQEPEPSHTELPEIVVTATRTKTDADDVTNTVSVISGETISERDQALASDALRGSPGLDITEFGSPGQSAFASIRGSSPDQVLVLLDGVQVNSPTVGQFDFANLTTDGIDRIEILRGGGGTLYGSEAIGGVVNVLTRRGSGPLTISASGQGGRAATQRESVGLDGAFGPFGVDGTVSYFGTDGFQAVNDSYQNFSTVWRGDADLLPTGTARAFVRYTGTRRGLPQFNVSEGELDPDAYDRSDFVLTKLEWEHTLADVFTYRASAAWWKNYERFRDNQNADGDDDDDDGDGTTSQPAAIGKFRNQLAQADAQADYAWRDWALTTLGVEFIERFADVYQLQTENDEGEEEQETDRFNTSRSEVGVYLEQQVHLLDDALRAVGGVRYDHIEHFGNQVTWSGSGAYLIQPTDTRLRLSYATGFRAPTFDELFEPTLGNPNLKAEESWEIDAGFTQTFLGGRLRFEPTYFYRQVDNLIEEVSDLLPGPTAGVPETAAGFNTNARLQGVELIAHAQPLPWLQLSANYTYLNVGSQTGPLLNRPRHRGTFAAIARRSGLFAGGDEGTAAVQVYAVGSRLSPDPFSTPEPFQPETLDGYGRTDLALSYRFGGVLAPLTVTAAVRNLFNRDYQESIGYPAPPAWFLIGLRYALAIPGV
jgi:vitamin B12 transporter